jgi:SAM-dependent methyltransferase
MQKVEEINKKFSEEYESEDSVRKYTTRTAGYGINYLLDSEYANIYLSVIDKYLRTSPPRPLRVMEFGCGGGMNIIRLVAMLEKRGIEVEYAYGTDFSERLIEAAQREAKNFLPPTLAGKLRFHVARNEQLIEDLGAARKRAADDLLGGFDLIIGVNTFRYCHRLHKERECAVQLLQLLRKGGVCVMIDMNNRFPAFRSHLKGTVEDPAENYLPTLEEYSSPFETAGFELLKKGNFCWVPHSAGAALTLGCRILTPFLNLVARSRAMRSLVIARKPA